MYVSVEDTFKYIPDLPSGGLIEFGVLNGNHLSELIKWSTDNNCPFTAVIGCDSWKGIPLEAEGVFKNPDWPQGVFNSRIDFKVDTDEECIAAVEKKIYSAVPKEQCPNLRWVSGFFSDSLTEGLGKELYNTISYAHIDCDLYISSSQCLDWLFRYSVLKEGSIIRFDDWASTPANGGQKLAWKQIKEKYQITSFQSLADNVFKLC